jgi:phage terminase large subunit
MQFIYTKALGKIRKMKSRIKVIQGGTSSSKTFSILAVLINTAASEPNQQISVVSESLPHLKRGAIRDFLNIMKMTGRYIDSHWNRTNFIYTFTNGSYIEFFGVEDADKLRGGRRTHLFANEANRVSEEAYTQLAMRTSKDIYIDFNPTNRFWAHDIEGAELLILTYKDNEGLSKTIIDFLESHRNKALTSTYWANWCRVYLDGQIGSLEGLVFNNWSMIDTLPEEAELIGYGLDFGFTNDPSACIGVYRWNGQLILDEVIFRKGLLNSQIAKLLKDEGLGSNDEIYADNEPKSIAEIKAYGFNRIQKATKGPDSILAGIQILQEYQMLVTKRSINLKRELETYSWRKDKDGQTTNIPEDINNHAIDATRYLALMKLGKKPKPSFKIYASSM